MISEGPDLPARLGGLLDLATRWSPAQFADILYRATELAAWEGREEVFKDGDGPAFAIEGSRLTFREQIDFLRQKRPKPTKSWLDALKGEHDRSFVVAGVTDRAMLEDFQAAIIAAAEQGRSEEDFAKDFDHLVEKYGWEYRGERNWRIRTIFETNIRTSFMAGRLRQMRDPDVVKLRPYWQYLHAESRIPKMPRKTHVAWNGIVLMWDDPWWNTHFPPNDWLCSCGVRTLSKRDLARLGKTGPDEAPRDALLPVIDKASGELVMQPAGIGQGWDYMPGDLWERAFRRELVDAPAVLDGGGSQLLQMSGNDQPDAMEDLRARARPFTSSVMPDDLAPEDYARAFLKEFDLAPGEAGLWTDAAGERILIADDLFRQRNGEWKAVKRGHGDHALLLAETLKDPDEIWVALRALPDPDRRGEFIHEIVRRYIRVDPDNALFVLFELGRRIWFPVTGYGALNRAKPDFSYLNKQRAGKLVWKRK